MNNKRLLAVILFMVFFFVVLFCKLFDIQINKHEDFDYYAKKQQNAVKVLRAERGFILDRNEKLLAYDRNDVSFYVDTRMIKDKTRYKPTDKDVEKKRAEYRAKEIDKIASKFAAVFGKPKESYVRLLKGSLKNICVEKKAPKEKAMEFKNFVADGLFLQEDPTRVFSYDNLASHVLGYVNNDYAALDGIEKFYNKELTGTDGKMLVDRDVLGRMVTVNEDATLDPVPGKSLVLTIDRMYQMILQEELKKGMEEFQSNSATAIIMNPNNGEILALANYPDYNPNRYWEYTNDARRNKCLTDTYEPGSTYKSITLSALLDRNLCREDERVFAENGSYKFKSARITDSHQHQWLTVREVLEQSSNIGMAKLIPRISRDDFYTYLRDCGFGNFTSIDLPGENKGRLLKPSNYDDYTQMTMSYGYGVSVTPVQLISAYAALVNGGLLYQPHFLKKEMTRDGKVIKECEPQLLRRIVKKETSERIKNIMVGVVEEGTGKSAKLDNMIVGGKTGTSKKLVNGRYAASDYNSSFVGFFPVKNPKVICLIVVDAPQVGRYGGAVAAPIFKNVAERLINFDGSLMDYNDNGGNKSNQNNKLENVLTVSEKLPNTIKLLNPSEKSKEEFGSFKKYFKKNIMPDLKDVYLRDALALLNQAGIKCRVSGAGKVVFQSIPPGETIKPGLICVLTCEEKKSNGARIN